MPFDELFYMVTRIRAVSNLPLSVDMEAGYGDSAEEIAANLRRLAQTGVAGVNLEDSRVINGVRQLDDASDFSRNLRAVCNMLRREDYRLFMNIRTDTYLLGHEDALQETILRGQRYKAAGADGLFVPCLTSEKDISLIAEATGLPLNVMCMPDLPSFDRLKRAGASRISMGNFVHSAMQSTLTDVMHAIRTRQTFEGLLVMKITDKNLCDIWYQALLERAPEYTGVFLLASKPLAYSVFLYAGHESPNAKMSNFIKMLNRPLAAGFRPCKVCRPAENAHSAPLFVEQALALVRRDIKSRVADAQLRQHGISPERVRRWFLQHHGITFQAFQRMQRVNIALQELKSGRAATDVALDNGYESLSGFGYTYKRLTGAAPTQATQVIVIHRFTTTLGPMFVCATERESVCWSLPIAGC